MRTAGQFEVQFRSDNLERTIRRGQLGRAFGGSYFKNII